MTSRDHDDAVVRAALQDLKSDDARSVPSFAAMLADRRPRRIHLRSSPLFWLAAAGLAIAAALVGYREVSRERVLIVPQDVAALVAWRPVTEGLMPSPTMLIGPRPPLGKSILDFASLTRGPVL